METSELIKNLLKQNKLDSLAEKAAEGVLHAYADFHDELDAEIDLSYFCNRVFSLCLYKNK